MSALSTAKGILENKMIGQGSSSGNIEDSEVGRTTSGNYKQMLGRHTVMPVLDSSLNHSTSQLMLLRKQRMLHEKMRSYKRYKKFGHDTDQVLMATDIPDFKDEVTLSRASEYSSRNPFNPVAKNGKRIAS